MRLESLELLLEPLPLVGRPPLDRRARGGKFPAPTRCSTRMPHPPPSPASALTRSRSRPRSWPWASSPAMRTGSPSLSGATGCAPRARSRISRRGGGISPTSEESRRRDTRLVLVITSFSPEGKSRIEGVSCPLTCQSAPGRTRTCDPLLRRNPGTNGMPTCRNAGRGEADACQLAGAIWAHDAPTPGVETLVAPLSARWWELDARR